jgi:hypothetical protein
MPQWDDEIDGLYELEPGAFVAARNALARRIKADGDKARAAAVAKLPRPTVVAWALNQVARDDRARVDALIDAAERQASAQADLMAGGDAADLRAATSERRAAAGEIVRAAAALAGPAHADAVRTTLDAALADPDLVETLRSGTLWATLDAPAGFGFGVDPDAGEVAPSGRGPKGDRRATAGARSEPEDEATDAARRQARADAEAMVARLEAEVTAAGEAVDAASTDLDEADDEVRDAEDALTAARLARGQVADTLAAARADHDRTKALVDEARRVLAELEDDTRR